MPASYSPTSAPHPDARPQAGTAAVCLLASLAVVTLNLAPGLEPALQAEAHLSPAQVGGLFFCELATMGLASWPFAAACQRFGTRRLALLALAAWAAAQAATAGVLGLWPALLAARAAAGLAAGTLMLLALQTAAAGPATRVLGFAVAAQILSGAALLALLPALLARGGLPTLFGALAGAALPLAWLLRGLPVQAAAATPPATAAATGPRRWAVGLVALLFNAAIGALWPFLPELAPAGLFDSPALASVLAGATLAGAAAAAAAAWAERRWATVACATPGMAALAVAGASLPWAATATAFTLATVAVSVAWNFSAPLLLSLGAQRQQVRSVNAAFASGLALGPLWGGWVLERAGGPALVQWACAALVLALAATRLLPAEPLQAKRNDTVPSGP